MIGGGGGSSNIQNGATNYLSLFLDEASPTESIAQQRVTEAGTLSQLSVRLDQNPGTGSDQYTFTVRNNGSNTTVTCTITTPATSCTDTTHSATFAVGDLLSISSVPGNSPSNQPDARWTGLFTGS
jgi:hypothetical protein